MAEPWFTPRAMRMVSFSRIRETTMRYFLRYGSVDGALGWPLRSSRSPAEVADTKDPVALGTFVERIAR